MTAPGAPGAPAGSPPDARRQRAPRIAILAAVLVLLLVIIAGALYARHRSARQQLAYEDAMVMGLDTLVTAEEGYFYDSARYTPSLAAFPKLPLLAGVHLTIDSAGARSWWGTATHARLPRRRCEVWVGTPPARFPAAARAPELEGKPTCFGVGGSAR